MIELIALPLATSPTGIILTGTTLLGDLTSTVAVTVSGTISSNTNESTIYLETSGGVMQIRIDSSTGFTKCPVLLAGKNAQIVCMRGSDEYFHAVTVEADY